MLSVAAPRNTQPLMPAVDNDQPEQITFHLWTKVLLSLTTDRDNKIVDASRAVYRIKKRTTVQITVKRALSKGMLKYWLQSRKARKLPLVACGGEPQGSTPTSDLRYLGKLLEHSQVKEETN